VGLGWCAGSTRWTGEPATTSDRFFCSQTFWVQLSCASTVVNRVLLWRQADPRRGARRLGHDNPLPRADDLYGQHIATPACSSSTSSRSRTSSRVCAASGWAVSLSGGSGPQKPTPKTTSTSTDAPLSTRTCTLSGSATRLGTVPMLSMTRGACTSPICAGTVPQTHG